jgi:Photosynthesis system II assembly factor YCF48/Putative zinc-finger
MEQLPKIVPQRLRTMAAPAAHPDADLLTAFAEGLLSDRERGGLLKHLAECAPCRDVVHVSKARPESSRRTLVLGSKSRLLSWPMLRWGALSACVMVVGAAVTMSFHRQARPVALESRQVSEVALEDRANFERRPAPTEEWDKLAPKIGPEQGTLGKTAPPLSANKKSDFDLSKRAKVVYHGQSGTPAVARNFKRDETILGNAFTSANAPHSSPQTVDAAPVPTGAKVTAEEQKNELVGEGSRAPSVPPSSEMVTVEAQAPAEEGAAPSRAKDAKQAAAREKMALAGAAGAAIDSRSENRLDLHPDAPLKSAVRPTPRWSISNQGRLQSSYDEGKSWQAVPLTHKAVFRAVAAVGSEVWVGGSDGTLYHSQDMGGHWIQVKPAVGGQLLTTDITAIEFTDSQHGKLVTSDAETWTTEDAGRNWQKK